MSAEQARQGMPNSFPSTIALAVIIVAVLMVISAIVLDVAHESAS